MSVDDTAPVAVALLDYQTPRSGADWGIRLMVEVRHCSCTLEVVGLADMAVRLEMALLASWPVVCCIADMSLLVGPQGLDNCSHTANTALLAESAVH